MVYFWIVSSSACIIIYVLRFILTLFSPIHHALFILNSARAFKMHALTAIKDKTGSGKIVLI